MFAITAPRLVLLSLAIAAPASAQWTVTLYPGVNGRSTTFNALSQTQAAGTSSEVQTLGGAAVWSLGAATSTILNPPSHYTSKVLAIEANQQVGIVTFGQYADINHAALWSGTAGSWVDLHPADAYESAAHAVYNGVQGGYRSITGASRRATLWTGSADSLVDIHPPAAYSSRISAMCEGQQAGSVELFAYGEGMPIAAICAGTPQSWTLIGPADGYSRSEALGCHAGQQVGYIRFIVPQGAPKFAAMWSGTPESRVWLGPTGSNASYATAVHSGWQAGVATFTFADHAGIWHGTADSWEDLHAQLPPGFTTSAANAIRVTSTSITVAGFAFSAAIGERAVIWTKSTATQCGPADLGKQGGVAGYDGLLDNNDFIVFVDKFFARDPAADLGSQGGEHQPDGRWDNNDFVVFIDDFFLGCCAIQECRADDKQPSHRTPLNA
jgi:hypothetical protein